MKLKSRSTVTVTEDIYRLDLDGDGERIVVYTEYLNDKGKVIDINLRNVDGIDIDDPALLEEVQEFVDALET